MRPIPVQCPSCRYQYVRGLPGEARLHAAYHTSYMWQRKPRPEARLAAFGGDVRVDANSPKWLQRIVHRCAIGLQRDEGYDFPQWGEDGLRECGPTRATCMRWCWSKTNLPRLAQ
jgi:hypothetical protein